MAKRFITAVSSAIVVIVLGGIAHAAYWNPVDVTLRDGASDVLKSDGDPVYAGNSEDFSRIVDQDAPSEHSGLQDVFAFEPWGKRDYILQSPLIEGGLPLVCNEMESRVTFFSRETPDWFTMLSMLPPGIPLASDSGFRCWSRGRGVDYYIDYPSSEVDHGNEAECATITRVDDSTYRFDVPPTCLAAVYRFDSKGANKVGGKIAEDLSLPFQITAVLEPTR